MGLQYHLFCTKSCAESTTIELSIVKYVELKHPDKAEQDLKLWFEFLFNHRKHFVRLLDSRGNESDIRKTGGDYVLGIKKFSKELSV